MLKKKVLIADNLAKRGWTGAGICTLCSGGSEMVDHLFVGCPFSKDLLISLLPSETWVGTCLSPETLWEAGCHTRGSLRKWKLTTIAATWWAIWLERNKRTFELKKYTTGYVEAEVKMLRILWFSHCSP